MCYVLEEIMSYAVRHGAQINLAWKLKTKINKTFTFFVDEASAITDISTEIN